MKIQRDKLRQYQKKIQTVLDREHEIAKEMLAKGDKQRALLALRKRKYQEQLLIKTDGQLQALEELVRPPDMCCGYGCGACKERGLVLMLVVDIDDRVLARAEICALWAPAREPSTQRNP
jgi:hypothetical protein